MRIEGRIAPVCGRISMDMTILDLTNLPQIGMGGVENDYENRPVVPGDCDADPVSRPN
jgi:hypothetical protein